MYTTQAYKNNKPDLKIPYHASIVCNELKSRITLRPCVLTNERVVTSNRCYFKNVA